MTNKKMDKKKEKADRLSEALRNNLRRRKTGSGKLPSQTDAAAGKRGVS